MLKAQSRTAGDIQQTRLSKGLLNPPMSQVMIETGETRSIEGNMGPATLLAHSSRSSAFYIVSRGNKVTGSNSESRPTTNSVVDVGAQLVKAARAEAAADDNNALKLSVYCSFDSDSI